ncbi:MAG: hypothetical protein KF709_05330 [Gemmatimonadaceae bacterium]|nr:hypothetical protein [Gemmatimonadaceae bacterium]
MQNFEYLVTEHGFRLAESEPNRVRFESETVYVEVTYDGHRSYELDLLVGRVGSEEAPFRIDEIVKLRQADKAYSSSLVQVTTAEALSSKLEQLARLLSEFGRDFISGHEGSFREAAMQRSNDVDRYARERALRAARAEAEEAWRKKDYHRFVMLMRPLRAHLSDEELSKLEVAERR